MLRNLEGDALKGISFNLRNNANSVCEADDEQDSLVGILLFLRIFVRVDGLNFDHLKLPRPPPARARHLSALTPPGFTLTFLRVRYKTRVAQRSVVLDVPEVPFIAAALNMQTRWISSNRGQTEANVSV